MELLNPTFLSLAQHCLHDYENGSNV